MRLLPCAGLAAAFVTLMLPASAHAQTPLQNTPWSVEVTVGWDFPVSGNILSREDAWHRAVEFLFERLVVRWEIAGTPPIAKQKELLARFRFASADERAWIRGVLREHLAEWFPDVSAP